MATILCSHKSVHFEGGPGSGLRGIYVAGPEQRRVFSDLEANTAKEMSERYGDATLKPLWRMEKSQVVGYGVLAKELAERREALTIFLPEQILPPHCSVFYFVFGDRWLVHGVRLVNDDGQVEWTSSRLPMQGKKASDMVVDALSERLLEAVDENYCIAVTENEQAFQELKEKLIPFQQEVVRLEALQPARTEQPLYKHQNHNLLMMTIALLALMVVMASGGWWLMQSLELKEKQAQVVEVRRQIGEIQLNEQIGHIRNPQELLGRMDKTLQQAPSSVLNAACRLGEKFGRLQSIIFNMENQMEALREADPYGALHAENVAKDRVINVQIQLEKVTNTFLIDQENLAKSVLVEQPWVRDVKGFSEGSASSAGGSLNLEAMLRVE